MTPGLNTSPYTHPPSRKINPSDCAMPKTSMPLDSFSQKKTRELPNLTECRACGSRTDTANGKNRIQTLYSEWRIVLLCPRCYHRLESSQICSYCFKEASDDCYSCGKCKRSLHRTCFLNYKSVPPWSYSICGSEFTVCIDCWVPKQIAHKRKVVRRCLKPKCSSSLDFMGDGVSKLLGDVVKDATCVMEKKADEAVKAREIGVKEASVAKRAVELASDTSGKCNDAQLAFQLHRAMNSSPRISKNRNFNGQNGLEPLLAYDRNFSGLKPTELVYMRRRKKPADIVYTRHRNKPNQFVYIRRRRKPTMLVYKRRIKQSEYKENRRVERGKKDREESCSGLLVSSSGIDSSMNTESRPFNYQDDTDVLEETHSDEKLVYHFLTYSRKKSNWERTPKGKTKFLYEGYNLESQATDREDSCSGLLLNSSGIDSSMNTESEPCNYQDGSDEFEDTQSDGKLVHYLLTYGRKKSKWEKTINRKTKFLYEGYNLGSQSTDKEESCSGLLLNSNGIDSNMNTESKPCNYQDGCYVFDDTQPDGELVHYLLTYSRKKSNWEKTTNEKAKYLYEGYSLESQATDSEQPESLTISTSTLCCSVMPHQALAVASDSCQDHS